MINLNNFVNREKELSQFSKMLSNKDYKYIMTISGDSGSGKSFLLNKMKSICNEKKTKFSEVTWRGTDSMSYLCILKKIRDDIDSYHFLEFNELVDKFETTNINISISSNSRQSIATGVKMNNSNISTICGMQMVRPTFIIPVKDNTITAYECTKITETFIKCLNNALKNIETFIIFIGRFEKMSTDVMKWIWNGFIDTIVEKNLKNIRIIISGNRYVSQYANTSVNIISSKYQLQPFNENHIFDYIQGNAIGQFNDNEIKMIAKKFEKKYNGHPASIALAIDALKEKEIVEWLL